MSQWHLSHHVQFRESETLNWSDYINWWVDYGIDNRMCVYRFLKRTETRFSSKKWKKLRCFGWTYPYYWEIENAMLNRSVYHSIETHSNWMRSKMWSILFHQNAEMNMNSHWHIITIVFESYFCFEGLTNYKLHMRVIHLLCHLFGADLKTV